MTRLSLAALVSVALTGGTAGATGADGGQTIIDLATGDGRFSTLVAAMETAGLVETLEGPGPFTVYAPVNSAFDALPSGTLATLLTPENADRLTEILLYHVDDRKLTARKFPLGPNHFKPMLTSARLCITKAEDGITIADSTDERATVLVADIRAANGVIHVIDKVLIPGERPECH